ncbi:MAG: hypothetical protein JWN74_2290 [Acidobacteriaceae bacterium]|nr:hypothetical protein [Acidobacteriaceae bacterium]
MARFFVELSGTRYEKKFKSDKTPFYVDPRGKVVESATAKRLDEALARHANKARSAAVVDLDESERPRYYKRFRPNGDEFFVDDRGVVVDEATAKTNLVKSENLAESARRQRIEQESATRRREAQARKRGPSNVSEADRTARRVKQLMSAGMNLKEATIAAVGRYVDSLPCE